MDSHDCKIGQVDLDFSIKMLFHSRNQVRFHFRKGLIKIDKHKSFALG